MPINPGQPQVRSLLQLLGWQDPNTSSGGGRRSASPSASGGGSGSGSGSGGGGGGGVDLSQLGDVGDARGGGGGNGGMTDHSIFGDIYTQPGMSDYWDPTTHMAKISDAQTAAAQGGTTLQGLAGGFLPRYLSDNWQGYKPPSDQGGFFTAADLFKKLGRDVPEIGSFQAEAPSTNNWRLLGMGPGWIMRNGSLINTDAGETRSGANIGNVLGGGNSGEQHMWGAGATALGTGRSQGVPNLIQRGLGFPVSYGWPGALQWRGELGTGMDRTT